MGSLKVFLGVVLGLSAVGTVGAFVTSGPGNAISPAVTTVLAAVLLYRSVRHPPAPRLWTRRRVVATGVVGGGASLVTVGCMVWVVAIRPELELKAAGAFGALLVLGSLVWLVRFARAEHAEALAIAQQTEH
ncbi:hypothetical protein ACIBL3_00105 [Kribbella sp. NPDC050124]|uniref:hypothetical protein n=1 Tax=Kribbella sp. NPDC050124 TaxID=3364114 RepID=UPI00379D2999